MTSQIFRIRGLWNRAACLVATVATWGFVIFDLFHSQPPGIVYAIEPMTAIALASLVAGGASTASKFFGSKKKETTTRPPVDPGIATGQIQGIERSLGGRPDFNQFLQGPGKSLSEAIARIMSAPVRKQAGRASGQRRETARRLGTLRTGGFTRRNQMANVDLQGTLSGISDRAFRTLPGIFQQTEQAPFQQRMNSILRLLGIQSGQGPTTTTTTGGGGAGPALAAGGEAAGDFGNLLV
ncbi:MAG TPA: hypothetical protein ENH62_05200, partial [Marinobacter sp.]|nr:hypothetical protein [Marinobacter sp.]